MADRVRFFSKESGIKKEGRTVYRQRTGFSRPPVLPINKILFLQRTLGNQAVQRLFTTNPIQTKLRIGQNDIYEQEADRVADEVMRMPEPTIQPKLTLPFANDSSCQDEEPIQTKPLAPRITPLVQRQESLGEEEDEELQLKGNPAVRQVQEMEEEEVLQGKFTTSETLPQLQGDVVEAENHTGMPDRLKAGLEQLSDMDLSGVRVHKNSSKPAQLNALAYTQGQDIYVGPGQEKHLPHEGWHAVQQMQGSVHPTIHTKDVSINDDADLEQEADEMGSKAVQMQRAEQASLDPATPESRLLQREIESKSVMKVSSRAIGVSEESSHVLQRYVDPTYRDRLEQMPDRELNQESLDIETTLNNTPPLSLEWSDLIEQQRMVLDELGNRGFTSPATENDLTVFQGTCPLTLHQLFQVFTLNQDNIEFQVTTRVWTQQTVRFTRDWVRSPQGVAILRGRIRYELSQEIGSQGAALLRIIDGLSGNQERIDELRGDYEIARRRHAADPDRAQSTGAHLVEEAMGQGVSWNVRPPLHAAWDVAGPRNSGVYTPVGGTVVEVTRSTGYGYRIKILHPQGPDLRGRNRPVYTNYTHLDEVLVSLGDVVHPGQAVGLMGNTRFDAQGVTTIAGIGTHLHFSVQQAQGNVVDEDGDIVWDRVNRSLSSDYERNQGIRPQQWFQAVTGESHPYRTLATEQTSSDQSREVLELEAQGIHRRNLRRRSGLRGSYTFTQANVGTITQRKGYCIQRRQAIGIVQFVRPAYIVSHTFLGIPIPVTRGLHPTMRTRLEAVEAELQRQYDALDPTTRPSTLREYAGIDTIKGWRDTTTLHGRGRAVDVNYRPQPYIPTRTTEGEHTYYGGEGSRHAAREISALRQPAVEVYDRAVSFMRTKTNTEETADVSNRRAGETASQTYYRFRSTSDALRDYLSLVFLQDHAEVNRAPVSNPETAPEADLLHGIPATERKDEATAIADIQDFMDDMFWQDFHHAFHLTDREQYIRILRDYEIVRRPMQYGDPDVDARHTRNPARGFLHMSEHFVVAMMDVGNLRWGACEFRKTANGDVHHFDLGAPHHSPAPASES